MGDRTNNLVIETSVEPVAEKCPQSPRSKNDVLPDNLHRSDQKATDPSAKIDGWQEYFLEFKGWLEWCAAIAKNSISQASLAIRYSLTQNHNLPVYSTRHVEEITSFPDEPPNSEAIIVSFTSSLGDDDERADWHLAYQLPGQRVQQIKLQIRPLRFPSGTKFISFSPQQSK